MAARSKSIMLANRFNKLALLAGRISPRMYSSRTTQPEINPEPLSPFVGHNFKHFKEGDGAVASFKADVNGVKLNFEVSGTGNKNVLLCPAALGSARLDYRQQLDNMNKDLFTLIGWDPRGYGFSQQVERDWPVHFHERDAQDAVALMEHVGNVLLPKYSIMGWSDGGITAMIMAAKNPQKVNKLVVWGSNAYVTEEDIEIYEKLRSIDSWNERMRSEMEKVYGAEKLQEMWSKWIDSMSRYLEERKGDICKEELAKIECPTLIVEGGNDPILPRFHVDHLCENIKNARLVKLPGGRHNLHMHQHREFNSIVEKFLIE